MAKSGPSRNPSFLNAFYDFEAPEKKKSTDRCSLPAQLDHFLVAAALFMLY
jgi:hypothetical protein